MRVQQREDVCLIIPALCRLFSRSPIRSRYCPNASLYSALAQRFLARAIEFNNSTAPRAMTSLAKVKFTPSAVLTSKVGPATTKRASLHQGQFRTSRTSSS